MNWYNEVKEMLESLAPPMSPSDRAGFDDALARLRRENPGMYVAYAPTGGPDVLRVVAKGDTRVRLQQQLDLIPPDESGESPAGVYAPRGTPREGSGVVVPFDRLPPARSA